MVTMVLVTVGSPALLQAPTWRWDPASRQIWKHLKVHSVFKLKLVVIHQHGEKNTFTTIMFPSYLTKTPCARRMLIGRWILMISWSFPLRWLRVLTSWLPRTWVIVLKDLTIKTSGAKPKRSLTFRSSCLWEIISNLSSVVVVVEVSCWCFQSLAWMGLSLDMVSLGLGLDTSVLAVSWSQLWWSSQPYLSTEGGTLWGCFTCMFVFSVPVVHPQRCGCQKRPVDRPQSSQDLWLRSGSWHHEWLKLRGEGQRKSLSLLSFVPLTVQRLLWPVIIETYIFALCRPVCQWSGWPQRVSSTVSTLSKVTYGPMGSCCGRSSP